jgi:hypothetical protein
MLRLTYWHWGGASNSPTENNGATSVIVIMPAAFLYNDPEKLVHNTINIVEYSYLLNLTTIVSKPTHARANTKAYRVIIGMIISSLVFDSLTSTKTKRKINFIMALW